MTAPPKSSPAVSPRAEKLSALPTARCPSPLDGGGGVTGDELSDNRAKAARTSTDCNGQSMHVDRAEGAGYRRVEVA
jgi:hypothetical protein